MEGESETGTFRPSGADAGDKNSGGGAEGVRESGQKLKLAEKLRGKTGCNDGNRCSVLGRRRIRSESSRTHQEGWMGEKGGMTWGHRWPVPHYQRPNESCSLRGWRGENQRRPHSTRSGRKHAQTGARSEYTTTTSRNTRASALSPGRPTWRPTLFNGVAQQACDGKKSQTSGIYFRVTVAVVSLPTMPL